LRLPSDHAEADRQKTEYCSHWLCICQQAVDSLEPPLAWGSAVFLPG
jgi:hypothetical protein